MPVDVAAAVIAQSSRCRPITTCSRSRRRLSPAAAAPGPVRDGQSGPRARSAAAPAVFGVRSPARRATARRSGISLLNKRIGVVDRPRLRRAARPARRLPRSARTAVHDRRSADRSVDGRRRRRTRAVCGARAKRCARAASPRRCSTARASGAELFYLDFFRALGVELVLTTEDGSAGERGRIVAPLERRARRADRGRPRDALRLRPRRHARRDAPRLAADYGRPCQVSVERIMGCGLGGCYSCVVPMRGDDGGFHHVRSCLAGPVLAGDQIVWD